MYDFNSISSRVIRAGYADYNDVVKKFINYVENENLIFDYIKDCGEPTYDIEKEIDEVRKSYGRVFFELGDTEREEVSNIYHILKCFIQNDRDIIRSAGLSYTSSKKYDDMAKAFSERVVMVLIRHIEGYLTKIGIDMGMDENIKYSITVNDGQVNLATDNAVINATQNNGLDTEKLTILIDKIKNEMTAITNHDEIETIKDNIDVIENEMAQANPRKGFIKTAISGLQAIKGTAEFSAAIVALIQFIQPFIN